MPFLPDPRFMRAALLLAQEAAKDGEVPVGAVIVRQQQIIATGRNRREHLHHALAHAEIEAIHNACHVLGSWRLQDCALYVTLEPCPMCAGAILNARLSHLVFGAQDPKAGACGSVFDLFQFPLNHHPGVWQGFLEEECGAVLTQFFGSLRQPEK